MKKRVLTLLMAVYTLCLLTMTACSATDIPTDDSAAEPDAAKLVSAAQQPSGFTDVPVDAWYAEAVAYCQENGVMNGTTDTTFAPEETLTRAMLATVLYRMNDSPVLSGPPDFNDVKTGSWYSDAVSWAAKNGVISGYGNGVFGVNDPTTREQAVAILWRYAGSPSETAESEFSDAAAVSNWAQAAVRWASANGMTDGMAADSRFNPKANIKRGEVASMLYHYLNLTASGQEPLRQDAELSENKIDISFNGYTYSAVLADNSSAKAFADLLKNGPLTISAHDYGSFEKVGELGTTLPQNDEQITTSAGDIILYQGNQITIYYAQNTWSFTRLGRMDDPSGLQEALGTGDVDLTFALAKASGSAENPGDNWY